MVTCSFCGSTSDSILNMKHNECIYLYKPMSQWVDIETKLWVVALKESYEGECVNLDHSDCREIYEWLEALNQLAQIQLSKRWVGQ